MGTRYYGTIGGHGRLGRTKTRDQSADLYCKPSYRSSSIDLTSPKTPLLSSRPRERSMDISSSTLRSADFSINGLERYRSRPKYRENDDDHSEDYKRIISRVNDANYITKDAEPMMEYINKSDLSPKSINVINKESLNQLNDSKKKNYVWREEMKGMEDKWISLNEKGSKTTRGDENMNPKYIDDYNKTVENLLTQIKSDRKLADIIPVPKK